MDQLLTKEQAEWLIENIKPSLSSQASSLTGVITLDDLRNFIYKHCVEKQFPAFNMNVNEGSIAVTEGDNMNGLYISVNNKMFHLETNVSIRKEAFKELTNACNNIVEWIDNHE